MSPVSEENSVKLQVKQMFPIEKYGGIANWEQGWGGYEKLWITYRATFLLNNET